MLCLLSWKGRFINVLFSKGNGTECDVLGDGNFAMAPPKHGDYVQCIETTSVAVSNIGGKLSLHERKNTRQIEKFIFNGQKAPLRLFSVPFVIL